MSHPAAAAPSSPAPTPATATATARRGPRWRTALSVVLIVVATLLAPVAVVSTWVRLELTSTDAFVSTLSPLASDPAIQQLVADRVTDAVEGQVDIDALTDQAFGAVANLDVPPRAKLALRQLSAPAAAGIRSMISDAVDRFVRSDAFQDVWDQALRTTHQQLLASQDGDLAGGAVTVGQQGEIAVQLAPVIAQVKQLLVARGVPLAGQIPEINRTIVVATVSAAPKVRMLYAAAVDMGTWLPYVVLALFAGAVWAANRHRRALVASGLCLTAAMILTALALRAGRIVAVSELAPRYLTSAAVRALWDDVTVMLRSAVLATGALALVTAVVAWLGAPVGFPLGLRRTATDLAATVRAAGERQGVTTGGFGRWLHAQRRLVLWAIAALSAVVVILSRPLTLGFVGWLVVVDVVLIVLLLLLERPEPGDPAPADSPAAGPAAA